MIKLEAIEDFTLGKFNELKELTRKNPAKNEKGFVYEGDIFECDEEMRNYLLGDNKYKRAFAKVIEVLQEEQKHIEQPLIKGVTTEQVNS